MVMWLNKLMESNSFEVTKYTETKTKLRSLKSSELKTAGGEEVI